MQYSVFLRISYLLFILFFSAVESIGDGTKAQPALYRWHVLFGGCGGAMISSKVGITACHCGITPGTELIIMDRSMKLQNPWEAWRKQPWHTKVKQAKQANPKDCSFTNTSHAAGYDYALFELEEEVSVCDDSRFGPMALMLPYITRPELNVSNLMRTGDHTQCLLVGNGAESAASRAKQTRFKSVMMFRADQFEIDNFWVGEERVFLGVNYTTSFPGDSGSPLFCIYDDVPYLTGVMAVSGGAPPANGGPNMQMHLPNLEKIAKEMGVWENIQESQKKCGNYYQKYGVINDYIDKIENCHYPTKPVEEPFYETDWYEYPDVCDVDTAGMNRVIEFDTPDKCPK